jgi:heme-degrading monooxygenase HmoA
MDGRSGYGSAYRVPYDDQPMARGLAEVAGGGASLARAVRGPLRLLSSSLLMAFTREPPYWAVIFSSDRTAEDPAGYAYTADEMVALASSQPGFLGVETARGPDGFGITVSYWESLEAIAEWRQHVDHQAAQSLGREKWYRAYKLRVARVERAYSFER